MEKRIIDCWNELLRANPEAAALIDPEGSRVSRGELDLQKKAVAARLVQAGLGKGEVLLVRVPNGPSWMAGLLASSEIGSIVVFADPGTTDQDLRTTGRSIRAKAVWTGEKVDTTVSNVPIRYRNSRLAMGKLTSGSTGEPKCLCFTDGEMLADGRITLKSFGYKENDRVLGLVPWGHAYGLGTIIMPFLLLGLEISGLQGPLPSEVEWACGTIRPTIFPAVPTVIKALCRSDCDRDNFSSLRFMISAGARLEPELACQFREKYGVVIKNLYGSSETGSIACDPDGRSTLEGKSVGKVIEEVRIWKGTDGRLRVESPAVFTQGNRSKGDNGCGICRVGDYGYLDGDGYVFLTARARGFVKIGEKRIGLADVESRLRSLDGVRGAYALSLDTPDGQVLGALIESDLDRTELVGLMRSRIPSKFRPRVWKVVSEFPTTERGKLANSEARRILEGSIRSRADRRS